MLSSNSDLVSGGQVPTASYACCFGESFNIVLAVETVSPIGFHHCKSYSL